MKYHPTSYDIDSSGFKSPNFVALFASACYVLHSSWRKISQNIFLTAQDKKNAQRCGIFFKSPNISSIMQFPTLGSDRCHKFCIFIECYFTTISPNVSSPIFLQCTGHICDITNINIRNHKMFRRNYTSTSWYNLIKMQTHAEHLVLRLGAASSGNF